MPFPWSRRGVREPAIAVADPRYEDWETAATFEDRDTAIAWRDQLRHAGIDAACAADHPLDRFGHGEIYLVVPRQQWSAANELIENLD